MATEWRSECGDSRSARGMPAAVAVVPDRKEQREAVRKHLRQVARRIGKSHVWVGQRLALPDLKPELQDELKTGDLTVEDARKIGKLPQEEQTKAAQTAKASRKTGVPRPRGKTAAADTEPAERQSGNAVTTPTASRYRLPAA